MPLKHTDKTESNHDGDLLFDTFDDGSKRTCENENDLKPDDFSNRRIYSSYLSFFKRLLSCIRSKKLIGIFLGISLIFHFFVINGIYQVSQTGKTVEPARHKITSKIKLIEDHKTPEKPQTAKPTPPVAKKPVKAIKPAKSRTVRAKKLSSEKLVALGKKHMSVTKIEHL